MIYGKYITDPADQQVLTSMIDYWISPNAVKRDFELPKCMANIYCFLLVLIYFGIFVGV